MMDYDHDYNPDYCKSTDLENMKLLCNLLGDQNHFQVTEYTFDMRVFGYQYFEISPNCGICTPVTDDMYLQKRVFLFLPMTIQDPKNATKKSTDKAMEMVDAVMDRH